MTKKNNTNEDFDDNIDDLKSNNVDELDEDELEKLAEDLDDEFFDLEDDENDDVELTIVTDLSKITLRNSTNTSSTKKPKVIGKHTLAYDSIHNSKVETNDNLEEDYYIQDLNYTFDVSNDVDVSNSYNSDEYYFSLELKKIIFDLLVKHTDIDFSPNKKRRIPSTNDLNAYFKMLIDELEAYRYSYTEIFISLSEFFSDKVWNVFKRLNNNYKEIVIKELKEKYDFKETEKIDFI